MALWGAGARRIDLNQSPAESIHGRLTEMWCIVYGYDETGGTVDVDGNGNVTLVMGYYVDRIVSAWRVTFDSTTGQPPFTSTALTVVTAVPTVANQIQLTRNPESPGRRYRGGRCLVNIANLKNGYDIIKLIVWNRFTG